MSDPVTAIVGGAAIGGASSIYGASKSASAAKKAAQTAADTEMAMYNQTREDYRPYREVGYGALSALADIYGLDRPKLDGETPASAKPVDRYGGFYESPNYQFRLNQGLNAVQRSAAARGRLFSGGAVKAVNDYAQGMASDEWSNWVNGLRNMAGVGQSATGSTASAGANAANVTAQAAMNAGSQRASSYLAGAEGVNNSVQGGLRNWIFYHYKK